MAGRGSSAGARATATRRGGGCCDGTGWWVGGTAAAVCASGRGSNGAACSTGVSGSGIGGAGSSVFASGCGSVGVAGSSGCASAACGSAGGGLAASGDGAGANTMAMPGSGGGVSTTLRLSRQTSANSARPCASSDALSAPRCRRLALPDADAAGRSSAWLVCRPSRARHTFAPAWLEAPAIRSVPAATVVPHVRAASATAGPKAGLRERRDRSGCGRASRQAISRSHRSSIP